MKRNLFFCVGLFLAGGAVAHADPVVASTAFDESVVYGTDTFETSGGVPTNTSSTSD